MTQSADLRRSLLQCLAMVCRSWQPCCSPASHDVSQFMSGQNSSAGSTRLLRQACALCKHACSADSMPKLRDGGLVTWVAVRAVIDKCFGFDTAVEEAQRALMAAKVEATSAFKGIGLVKLMGRQSGFITMQASMASGAAAAANVSSGCQCLKSMHLKCHESGSRSSKRGKPCLYCAQPSLADHCLHTHVRRRLASMLGVQKELSPEQKCAPTSHR